MRPSSGWGEGYQSQGGRVLAGLPEEVAEEGDDQVVVGADEAAEEADVLSGAIATTMERLSMSM